MPAKASMIRWHKLPVRGVPAQVLDRNRRFIDGDQVEG
jgi:hypothetical protein